MWCWDGLVPQWGYSMPQTKEAEVFLEAKVVNPFGSESQSGSPVDLR